MPPVTAARSTRQRWSSARAVQVALPAATLALGALTWRYTVDDAFVIGRYARRIATGLGYTFVDGPATDGVTGPAYLLPGIAASVMGLDAVAAAKLVGLLCAALSVALVVLAARRRVVGSLAAPVAGAWLLLAPSFVVWSVAGLETGAAALASTVLAIAVLHDPRPRVAAVAAAILVTLRPECVPLAGALVSYLARRRGRDAWPAVVVPVLALLGLAAIRWAAFGSALPLSASAKPSDLGHGASYAVRVVFYGTALSAIPLAIHAARGSRRMRVLGVALLVHLVAITIAGGDWMPGVRLFVPAQPLLAWMVGVGVADLTRLRPGRGTLTAAIGLLLVPPLALTAIETWRADDAGEAREGEGRALASHLDAHAHRVALVDIGFLSYVTSIEPVDLAGITDPSIGRLPGGHVDKPVTGAMLVERGVDAIVLHSSTEPTTDEDGHLTSLGGHPLERRLAMDENVRSAFAVTRVLPYAEGYFYVVLERR